MEDSGRFLARIPRGVRVNGGFRKVPGQNTLGVRVNGGFRKVPSQNT